MLQKIPPLVLLLNDEIDLSINCLRKYMWEKENQTQKKSKVSISKQIGLTILLNAKWWLKVWGAELKIGFKKIKIKTTTEIKTQTLLF